MFVLFTLFKLTLDEHKTLTKISTHKTSHNHSPNQRTLWTRRNKKTSKQQFTKRKRKKVVCILMECTKTSGMPDVVSGSSITVDPLDLIIFLMPSWVQMMPMKFVDVKSMPKMTGRCMCLQTIKDWVNGWLLIVKVQVT